MGFLGLFIGPVLMALLVASGSPVAGIALLAWGSTELFIVDKTLRPRLVGGPIKLPFLPTFFGLIGGVKTMGFLGLFIGPVLMALLVAIWREWLREVEMSDEPVQEFVRETEAQVIEASVPRRLTGSD
jgi:predicted PurR-regulated permease PerM